MPCDDFRTIYRIRKELQVQVGHKLFDGSLKEANGRLLIDDHEKLTRWEILEVGLRYLSWRHNPTVLSSGSARDVCTTTTVMKLPERGQSPMTGLRTPSSQRTISFYIVPDNLRWGYVETVTSNESNCRLGLDRPFQVCVDPTSQWLKRWVRWISGSYGWKG